MTELLDEQKVNAKSFLNDLFIGGGILKQIESKRDGGQSQTNFIAERQSKNASIICNELLYRNFDFFNVDKALDSISTTCWFLTSLTGKAKWVRKKPEMLAKYIAAFCSSQGLLWDDVNTSRSAQELEQYRTASTMGKACWAFRCFLSQQSVAVAPVRTASTAKTSAANIGTTSASAATAGGQNTAPQNTYKSAGPQSAKARDLISTPGQKEYPSGVGGKLLDLEFDQKGTNIPCLFIDPLGTKGATGTTNKVMEGSAKGYTDCAVYFNDFIEADNFLAAYVKKYNLSQRKDPVTGLIKWDSQKYTGLCAKTVRKNPNGYFKINTDCGPCYINAVKLNEGLNDEPLAEVKKDDGHLPTDDEIKKSGGYYGIQNIDVYEEAFERYE